MRRKTSNKQKEKFPSRYNIPVHFVSYFLHRMNGQTWPNSYKNKTDVSTWFECFEPVNIANGSKKPNLVFRLPFLLEKKNDANGKHNLFPDYINPEKPDVPLNKNDAFQKVQKRRVQEKRWARSYSAWSKPTVFLSLEPSLNGFKISFKSHCRFKIIPYLYAMLGCYTWHFIRLRVQHHVCIFSLIDYACTKLRFPAFLEWAADKWVSVHPVAQF